MLLFCGEVYTPEEWAYIKQNATLLKSSSILDYLRSLIDHYCRNSVRVVGGVILLAQYF